MPETGLAPAPAAPTSGVTPPANVELTPLLSVEHLTAFYGRSTGVPDVTLSCRAKTGTALIGPSGCGKSTFLRTLNRMHELAPGAHVEGKVLLDGHDIYEPDVSPIAVRRRIGMVFQKPTPFPTMSIRE